MIQDIVATVLIGVGTFFMGVASLGLIRLPDLYTRLHALTKSATLGLVSLLLAAAIELASWDVSLKVLFAVVFHFLTNPVAAHMITRAAYHHLKVPFWDQTVTREWPEEPL